MNKFALAFAELHGSSGTASSTSAGCSRATSEPSCGAESLVCPTHRPVLYQIRLRSLGNNGRIQLLPVVYLADLISSASSGPGRPSAAYT
jgi:hypothetical protein